MVLFKAENLSFTYPLAEKKALNSLDITINQGDFILLMGKSGSGKSTFLRLLSPNLSPHGKTEGNIENNAESIGFVLQNPEMSFVCERVRGELAFALENQSLPNDEIAVKIGEIASFFNIANILDKEISTLSGGEKAIVSIASAMIADVQALILDEPLSQLDAKASRQLIDMLKRINDELGIAVIISSHSSQDLINISSRLVVLENGRIICDSSPKVAVENEEVINFLPEFTRLFKERPLTVKQAIEYSSHLKEKPFSPCEKTQTAVSLKNVSFAYSKDDRDILTSLNYKAYQGKINSVIGSNGSCKTTL
ncbi:MAG: ABC transporter ATP-binding protein, partial [Eubacterium sp.]